MREKGAALAPYRMLDLTNERGLLCGKIFADLGADVIKIEPPGGDRARNIGPFYNDIPDREKSLFWFAFNTGKKSITLNIETADGQEILKKLVKAADFLIESFDPGYLDDLGIGYTVLSKSNRRLIMGSITPFGQNGPYAHWKGPDIVPWAMSGYMWMTGESGRAPLRISCPPQTYLHASAITAAGLLLALRYREMSRKGQHVDTSAQQCPTWMLTHTYAYWDLLKVNLGRAGVLRQFGEKFLRTVWPCRDGYITFMFAGGLIGAKGQRRVVELMEKEGMAEDWLKEFNWEEWSADTGSQEEVDRISEAFGRFFKTKTKAELLNEAVKSSIMLAPVNTIADTIGNPQLKDRDYWVEVEHPELGAIITYPGAPCKLTETPWHIKGRAPLIGEHNSEIYEKELGFSKTEIVAMQSDRII
jgi:benzylsuccinate CoA-transferase BbsE subunit